MSFFRQSGIGAVMALTLAATGAATGAAWNQALAGETALKEKPAKITGTAAYRERIAVSSDAELVVELRLPSQLERLIEQLLNRAVLGALVAVEDQPGERQAHLDLG